MFDNFKLTIASSITTVSNMPEYLAGLCLVKINKDDNFYSFMSTATAHSTFFDTVSPIRSINIDYDNGDGTWRSHIDIVSKHMAILTLSNETFSVNTPGSVRLYEVLTGYDGETEIYDYYCAIARPFILDERTPTPLVMTFEAGSFLELRTNVDNVKKPNIVEGILTGRDVGQSSSIANFLDSAVRPSTVVDTHADLPILSVDEVPHFWTSITSEDFENAITPTIQEMNDSYFVYFTVNSSDGKVVTGFPSVSYGLETELVGVEIVISNSFGTWNGAYDNGGFYDSFSSTPVTTPFASDAEAIAGTITDKVVSPASMKAHVDARGFLTSVSSASTSIKGIVELATTAEATTGTDTSRAVTSDGVKAHVDSRLTAATETTSGIVELATITEAATAADTTRAVTPAGLGAALASYGSSTNIVTYLDDNQYRKFGISGFHATWQASPIGTSAPGAPVSTSTSVSDSTTYLIPFVVSRAITISALSVVVATLSSGSSCKVGLYNTDNTSTTYRTTASGGRYRPTTVIAQSGALDCTTTGTKTYTLGTPATLQPGLYMFAVIVSTATTLRIHMRTAAGGDGDMDVIWRDRAANTTVPFAFTTKAPGNATSATFPDNPSITSGTILVASAPIVYFNYTLV